MRVRVKWSVFTEFSEDTVELLDGWKALIEELAEKCVVTIGVRRYRGIVERDRRRQSNKPTNNSMYEHLTAFPTEVKAKYQCSERK